MSAVEDTLPWEVGGPSPSVSIIHFVDGGNGVEPPAYDLICWIDHRLVGEQDPESLALAEYIVRAVNAHAALLDACKQAAEHHQGGHSTIGKTLRDAILKATP